LEGFGTNLYRNHYSFLTNNGAGARLHMKQTYSDKYARRGTFKKIVDFSLFPFRALVLIERDRWHLTSLASERFYYASEETTGFCLDVGCGKGNRFINEFLHGNGRGIDVFKYEGLTDEHIVDDITHFPFDDENFETIYSSQGLDSSREFKQSGTCKSGLFINLQEKCLRKEKS